MPRKTTDLPPKTGKRSMGKSKPPVKLVGDSLKRTETFPDSPKNGEAIDSLRQPRLILLQGGKNQPQIEELLDSDQMDSDFQQDFHPLRGETAEGFSKALYNLALAFRPSDPLAHALLCQYGIIYFEIKRTENAMSRLSDTLYETEPEKWLKIHAAYVTERNALLVAGQRLLAAMDRLANRAAPGSESLKYDSDGKRIEEYRFWNIYKFSEAPNDTLNEAVEVIGYVDGGADTGQTVQLDQFMNGEFMKPEYGLGDQFRRMLRRYKQPLHHPFDPARLAD